MSRGAVSPHFCNQEKNLTGIWIAFVKYMVQWNAFVATVMKFMFYTDVKCLGQLHKSNTVVWKGPVPDSILYYQR
jgi:hypothetical protein